MLKSTLPAARPKYLEMLKGHADETIAEPGCIEFNVAQNPASPSHLVLMEVYKNKTSMDAHSRG